MSLYHKHVHDVDAMMLTTCNIVKLVFLSQFELPHLRKYIDLAGVRVYSSLHFSSSLVRLMNICLSKFLRRKSCPVCHFGMLMEWNFQLVADKMLRAHTCKFAVAVILHISWHELCYLNESRCDNVFSCITESCKPNKTSRVKSVREPKCQNVEEKKKMKRMVLKVCRSVCTSENEDKLNRHAW